MTGVRMNTGQDISTDPLLAAAHRVFSEEGFRVTTDRIARAAGVRESEIGERFRTKGDLFLRAMEPPTTSLEEFLEGLGPDGDASAQLEEVALLLFDHFRELAPILFVVATDLYFDYAAFRRDHPSPPHLRLQAAITDFLKARLEFRRLRQEVAEAAVLNLFSTLHSLAVFEALGAYDGACPESVVRSQATLVVKSLSNTVEPGRAGFPCPLPHQIGRQPAARTRSERLVAAAL